MTSRLTVLKIVVLTAFGLLVLRLFQLQVLQGPELRRASEQNRIRRVRELAPRGIITDRAGRILASNRAAFAVSVLPPPQPRARQELLRTLARLLGTTPAALESKLATGLPSGDPCLLAEDVDGVTLARIEEHAPQLSGVSIQIKPVRFYPYATLAGHVLGYVREVDRSDLQRLEGQGYRQGDRIGKSGIERLLESHLRGREGGQQVEVDAGGRVVRVLGRVPPRPGGKVVLTLDLPTQQAAEQGLAGKRGAVVALDPKSGQVLALSSSPGFDPNWFVGALAPERWRYLNGRARPQQNRATTGRYAPGSTFKVVVAAAALERAVASPATRFHCPGFYRLGKWRFRCWKLAGHGSLSFVQALAQSCNVAFMTMGRRLGIAQIAAMARRLGLGQPTGCELTPESSGLVPDPHWKRQHRHQPWYPGDTCQVAIGQGDVLVTPMQAAVMISAIANGGYLVRPHLVKVAPGYRAPARQAIGLSSRTVAALQAGLERVVEEGTARSLSGAGVPVAGKTGTAENPHGAPHAWFVGYAPADHPRVAVAVLVEGGGHGGAVAAPIAGQVMRAALRLPQRTAPVAAAP